MYYFQTTHSYCMKLSLFLFLFLSIITLSSSSCLSTIPNTELRYLVREPKILAKAPPLIILLHGWGSNEDDLFSLANNLPDQFLVVSARGPINVGPKSYGWYHLDLSTGKIIYNKTEAELARITIIQFLQNLKSKHPYNASQVYLFGFSQGAIMSLSVALTRPDLIKGIAVMSGQLLEEIKPILKKGRALNNLRIFISHGSNDHVLSINQARNGVKFLIKNNLYPEYHEYPEPHTISHAMFQDMLQWLNKK